MIKHIISWLNGRKIDEIRCVRDNPYIIGNFYHFLPTQLWTEEEKDEIQFCFRMERWNGFNWEFVKRVQLKHDYCKTLFRD